MTAGGPVLAIDQGTSATKAVVACPERGLLAEVDVPFGGAAYDGEAVTQDPIVLWESVVEAGRRALALAGEPVAAVGLGNQGETVLAWDPRTGEPLADAVSWQDRRSVAVTDALAGDSRVDAIVELTGLPLDPYFAAPKMAWLARHAGRLPAGAVITTIDAWTTARLAGPSVTDAATASRTMLLDPGSLSWSDTACALFGIDAAALPEVVPCDARVGTTTAFGAELPVVGLIVDQQAALLAQDCRDPGSAKCTYGTGAFLLANVGTRHRPSATGLATSIAWAMADGTRASCVDGQVYSVGAAVSWLQRVGIIGEPADLDRLGMAVDDSGGACFVPTLAGMGAPLWRPDARGSFTGLSLSTTREHLVRAFCEGIAAQVAMLALAVAGDTGAAVASLRVDGGLTRSRLLMQSQADLLGVPVEVYPHDCATALGIAALALRGSFGPGAEDAIVSGWSPSAVYEPRAGRADEIRSRFARALASTVDS